MGSKDLTLHIRTLVPHNFYDTLFTLNTEQKIFDFFTKKQDLIFSFYVISNAIENTDEVKNDLVRYFNLITQGGMYHFDFHTEIPNLLNVLKTKDENKINSAVEFLKIIELALMSSSLYTEDHQPSFYLASTKWELELDNKEKIFVQHIVITNNNYYTNDEQLSILHWKHSEYLRKKGKSKKNSHRSPLDHKLRHEVFLRDEYKCKECGITNKESTLHVDHIIAFSQGGSDELTNLQTLCEKCNLAKSNKSWKGGMQ